MENCKIEIVINGDSMEFVSKDLGIEGSDSMSGAGGFTINKQCKDKEKVDELLQIIHEKLHDLYYSFKA
jgi:hypothetical protein